LPVQRKERQKFLLAETVQLQNPKDFSVRPLRQVDDHSEDVTVSASGAVLSKRMGMNAQGRVNQSTGRQTPFQ
jgi:hypothetical protein